MTCNAKITMTICAESSTDAVAKLRAEGMGFNAACKLVANEFNKKYRDDKLFKPIDWKTLKKRSIREEKKAKSGDTVTSRPSKKQALSNAKKSKTEKVVPTIPMLKEEHKPIYTTIYTMVEPENLIQPAAKNDNMVAKEDYDLLETKLKESRAAIRNLILSKKENSVPAFTPPANFTPPTFSSPAEENDRIVELEAELKQLKKDFNEATEYIKIQENKLEELKVENDQLREKLNLKPKQQNNEEFVEEYRRNREAKRIAERIYHNVNPDGTPKE